MKWLLKSVKEVCTVPRHAQSRRKSSRRFRMSAGVATPWGLNFI